MEEIQGFIIKSIVLLISPILVNIVLNIMDGNGASDFSIFMVGLSYIIGMGVLFLAKSSPARQ